MLHKTSELAGFCEDGDEISGSVKGEGFFDKLSDY
jgi:hypothetical protein